MAEIANNSIDIQVVETGTETAQYFWHNTVDSGAGEGAGAHITELPKGDFVADPANGGANTLIDSTTMHIRDGITDLAEFSDDGLKFTARNGQETFSIACDNATSTDNVYCYSASKILPAHDSLTIRYQRLKTAESGTSLLLIYSLGGAMTTESFTKGTAETKTDSDVGLTIAYDGDYTFIATSTSSNEFVFQACRFSKTWYGTDETLHGDATIDGNADIYNDLLVGGSATFCSPVTFADPEETFAIDMYEHAYSNISSGGNMNWSETKTKNGYYPIGVVGFSSARAGLYCEWARITGRQLGSCTIEMHCKNGTSSTISGNTACLYVLWIKVVNY